MAFDVVISRRAVSRINSAIRYIEDSCDNRAYAKRLYNAIERFITELKTSEGFRIRDQAASNLLGQDVYRIRVGKYKLLYLVNGEAGAVVVFSFLHQAQDLNELAKSDFVNMD